MHIGRHLIAEYRHVSRDALIVTLSKISFWDLAVLSHDRWCILYIYISYYNITVCIIFACSLALQHNAWISDIIPQCMIIHPWLIFFAFPLKLGAQSTRGYLTSAQNAKPLFLNESSCMESMIWADRLTQIFPSALDGRLETVMFLSSQVSPPGRGWRPYWSVDVYYGLLTKTG